MFDRMGIYCINKSYILVNFEQLAVRSSIEHVQHFSFRIKVYLRKKDLLLDSASH